MEKPSSVESSVLVTTRIYDFSGGSMSASKSPPLKRFSAVERYTGNKSSQKKKKKTFSDGSRKTASKSPTIRDRRNKTITKTLKDFLRAITKPPLSGRFVN